MTSRILPTRPEVVFLDVGDTLVRAEPSWASVYRRVLADFGVETDEDGLRDALDTAFEADLRNEGPFDATSEASYQRLKAFDTEVLVALGHEPPPDEFFRSLAAAFAASSAWWVFEEVPSVLDVLRANGFRLAVISNWSWTAPELLHTLELTDHFEALAISDRIGYNKPHRGIFDHARELMHVEPGQAIHVGDSITADVRGARTAGIQPVLIERGRASDPRAGDGPEGAVEHRSIDGVETPVIRDLLGLLDLLGVSRPIPAAVA